MGRAKHSVAVYFAAWHLREEASRQGGEAAGIPWESIDILNHAFWYVVPAESPEVSSFQRRREGHGPRTEFRLIPLEPEADLGPRGLSARVPGLPGNHFAQYAYFAERYPHVRILISVGGWTRSGFFSEMAYTAEGRVSFIRECLALTEQYPWIGGFDIDWEYPGGSREGERLPDGNDPSDGGCPIFGTAREDRENFARLLSELRSALDSRWGSGGKMLTACASGSVEGTLPCQDWAAAAPSLDFINIMSYDLAGVGDGVTGHASGAAAARAGAEYLLTRGVPSEKICIGAPLYGTPFRMREITPTPLGSACEPEKPIASEACTQSRRILWEEQSVSGYRTVTENGRYVRGEDFDRGGTGWHMGYDGDGGGAYLYNDDEGSPFCRWFVSWENPLSLQRKLDCIREMGLGGILFWETFQDAEGAPMIAQAKYGPDAPAE